MLRRLKVLKRLQDVQLRPEEAPALMQRVATNTCNPEDRDLLAQVIRVTTQVSAQLVDPLPSLALRGSEHPASQRQAKRKRQLAKAARRRNRG